MSVAFLNAAFAAKMGKSSLKSVLVTIADRADDVTGFCFPSIADIVDRTELDRKTVLACMNFLEEECFIVDTKKRIGKTNQIKIWQLNMARILEASQKRDGCSKASQNRDGSIFPREESRFSARRVPKLGHGTTTEPSFNHHLAKTVEIDDLVASVLWWYQKTGKQIKSQENFVKGVKKRILKDGAGQEDFDILQKWRCRGAGLIVDSPRHDAPPTADQLHRLSPAIKKTLSKRGWL